MKAKLIKEDDGYVLYTQGFFKASTNYSLIEQLNIEDGNIRYKLSKQNCDEIFGVVDVEKLARNCIKHRYNKYGENITSETQKLDTIYGFKDGFNKAMELNKDKVFTLEDMKRAFKVGFSNGFASDIISMHRLPEEKEKLFNEFIQSIQQPTEIEVEIVMEKVVGETKIVGSVKEVKGSGNKITTYKSVPKLDVDGCLTLKRI
jgi:hypothetical protein